MNFLLHRQKIVSHVKIPDGLKELMGDITKEVLKKQPDQMEAFIADYLESLLKSRDNFQVAQETVDDVLDASFYIKEIMEKTGVNLNQAKFSVKVISEEFDKHFSNLKNPRYVERPFKEVDIIIRLINDVGLTTQQAKNATCVIETAYNNYYNRKMGFKLDLNIPPEIQEPKETSKASLKSHQIPVQSIKSLLNSEPFNSKIHSSILERLPIFKPESAKKHLCAKEELERQENAALIIQSVFRRYKARAFAKKREEAAIKLQSFYRAYSTRKQIKNLKLTKNVSSTDMKHMDEEQAATLIQSTFRGFKVRKNLQTKKLF